MSRPSAKDRFPRPNDRMSGGPALSAAMHIRHEDALAKAIYGGEIFWELRNGKTGELQDSGHMKNVVTRDASILVARLMKGTVTPNLSEPSFGSRHPRG